MHTDAIYLRPEIKIEPLVCRWHAFQHLVSPVQAALNIANRQVPLLESFLRSPSVHISASADPALYGGAFVDLTEDDIPSVKALLVDTREQGQALITLANDVRRLNNDVRSLAKGGNLDTLYGAVPAPLKGAVEFAYDTNNVPFFRIREALLYGDGQGSDHLQEIMLQDVADDGRKFFLNTPRVREDAAHVFIKIPFASPGLDALASARIKPTTLSDLSRALDLDPDASERLAHFVTRDPPLRVSPDHLGDGVRLRYFGHACVLAQTRDVSILIDPTFAYQRNDELATLTFADLPDVIDYVVISHSHQDHFCLESLLQLRSRIRNILIPRNNTGSVADPSLKLVLTQLGFSGVRVMEDLDRLEVPGGAITTLPFPGEHSDLDIYTRQCIAITLEERNFLFMVDSDAVDDALYARLSRYFKNVDALFIGMECHGAPLTWLYGPLLMKPVSRGDDQSRRGSGSNSARAFGVVEHIGARQVFVYAMGLEPWNNHLLGLEYTPDSIQMVESDRFIARCEETGISSERLKGCREMVF